MAEKKSSIPKSPSLPSIQIGKYIFTLTGYNPNHEGRMYVTITSKLEDKIYTFCVYLSSSQCNWRFGIDIGGTLYKFSDYTSTTVIHYTLQEFINNSIAGNAIPIDHAIRITNGYDSKHYVEELVKNDGMKKDINTIFTVIDDGRKLIVPDLFVLSIFAPAHNETLSEMREIIIKHTSGMTPDDAEIFVKETLKDLKGYEKKLDDKPAIAGGACKSVDDILSIEDKLEFIDKYLRKKVKVVDEPPEIINLLADGMWYFEAYNPLEHLDIESDTTIYVRTDGASYNPSGKPATALIQRRRKKEGGGVERYIPVFNILIFRQKIALESGEYYLIFMRYIYRKRQYNMPLSILPVEGYETNINQYGLPAKYIPTGIYGYKAFDYINQINIKKDKDYNIYHVTSSNYPYVFIGNLYTEMWPFTKDYTEKLDQVEEDTYGKYEPPVPTIKKKKTPQTGGSSGGVSWNEFFMGKRYTQKRKRGGSSHRRHPNSRKSRAGRS